MDQPISCEDIIHIYKHPLSILIHLKFQDKDGCSKNGSRELLFSLKVEDGRNIDIVLDYAILDLRRVPLYLVYPAVPINRSKSDDERTILGFKQFNLNINSQFPIVQEEREALTCILKSIPDLRGHKILNIFDKPILGRNVISSVCGYVIRICYVQYYPLKFTSSNHSQLLSSLTQLQHLRSLSLSISKSWDHQEQFYEELGDQLGSKLVHLDIRSSSIVQTLELLSDQMFKFSSLKVLNLDINSRDFNPSLEI